MFLGHHATTFPTLNFTEAERSSRIIVEKTTSDDDWQKTEDKSSSGEVNEEVTGYFGTQNQGGIDIESEQTKKDKLSQLRQLLEKNLKSAVSAPSTIAAESKIVVSNNAAASTANVGSAFRLATTATNLDSSSKVEVAEQSEVGQDRASDNKLSQREWENLYPPGTSSNENQARMAAAVGTSLCQRRRVSFNPLVVQDTTSGSTGGGVMCNNSSSNATNIGMSSGSAAGGAAGGSLHPSPGTRKRHFSFQPISPRQNSLPQSPVASPFISPRSTPVHMLRSRHSSGSALPLHLLPGQSASGKVSGGFNSASSDISRAATFGSTSECSTPFISPHGTPVPFNRYETFKTSWQFMTQQLTSFISDHDITLHKEDCVVPAIPLDWDLERLH